MDSIIIPHHEAFDDEIEDIVKELEREPLSGRDWMDEGVEIMNLREEKSHHFSLMTTVVTTTCVHISPDSI